jgi:hypothetical protein
LVGAILDGRRRQTTQAEPQAEQGPVVGEISPFHSLTLGFECKRLVT